MSRVTDIVDLLIEGMKQASGGVVFAHDHNDRLHVLLRRPTNDFGGHVWTFSKGGVDHGESLEDAATRETHEETGYNCKILGKVPLTKRNSQGTTSETHWFVMHPHEEGHGEPGWETEDHKWVPVEDASDHIKQTLDVHGNQMGHDRDQAVLADAVKWYKEWSANNPDKPRIPGV